MKSHESRGVRQLGLPQLLFDHFYIGIIITLFYILVSPLLIDGGLPGLSVLLAAEVLILAPLGIIHLYRKGVGPDGSRSIKNAIGFREKMSVKAILIWSAIGIIACLVLYAPFYPLGLYLRETVFAWLPEWYFNPTFGSDDTALIAKVFLLGILIDGFVGPVVEELFFRGYLLPRMERFKHWAPILNGTLFGLYHFWQPHNLLPVIGVGIIISYIVWKKKNVYLGIVIHCTLNVVGALAGYLAVSNGIMVGR